MCCNCCCKCPKKVLFSDMQLGQLHKGFTYPNSLFMKVDGDTSVEVLSPRFIQTGKTEALFRPNTNIKFELVDLKDII